MRRWPTWAALAVVTVVGLACNGEGDSPGGGDEPQARKVCDTRVVAAPYAVIVHRSVVMRTETRSSCDVPPTAHVVHITVEYRAERSSAWTPAYRAEPCRELPRPGNSVNCQANGYGICKPGDWRTRVLVTGSGPDGRAFAFDVPEMPERTIRECPRVG